MIYTIFAHYDKERAIDDYVVYYLKQLSKISSEIIFVSDGKISEEELRKIDNISNTNITVNHGEYDFGSYKRGFLFIKDKLTADDLIIFCNDSCFGPVLPLELFLGKMGNNYDFWGVIKAKFIQTFFFVVGPKFFQDEDFIKFFVAVKKEKNKNILVEKYEKGLTALAQRKKLRIGAYYEEGKAKKLSINDIKKFFSKCGIPDFISRFIPQHSGFDVYNDNNFYLRSFNFPFIKKSIFTDDCLIFKFFWRNCINTPYDSSLIDNYLSRKKIKIKKFTLLALCGVLFKRLMIKILDYRFLICYKKTNKGNCILKFCKIPIYYKKKKKDISPKIAVHLHLFYEDLFAEIEQCLQSLSKYNYKLFVTGHNINPAIKQKLQTSCPHVEFLDCPNQGYDIGPFIKVLNSLNLDEYDFLIKLHTKRNVRIGEKINHFDVGGSKWRRYCLNFIATPTALIQSVRTLSENPKIGMVADGHLIIKREEPNDRPLTGKAIKIIKNLHLKPSSFYFVAGTMFMVKTEVLKRLQYKYSIDDFPQQAERKLDTPAHVFERVLGFIVSAEGYRISDYQGRNSRFKIAAVFIAIKEAVLKFIFQKKVTKHKTLLVKVFKIPVFIKRNKGNAI